MSGLEFTLDGPGFADATVLSASVREAISSPTTAQVEFVVPEPFDPDTVIDKAVRLSAQRGADARIWELVVTEAEYLDTRSESHRYRVGLTHALGLLALRSDVRAFQKQKLRDIVAKVVEPASISAGAIQFCVDEDPEREYIVQYRETDLAFLERLLGEEGATYLLTRSGDQSVLVVADMVGDYPDSDLGSVELVEASYRSGVWGFSMHSNTIPDRYATNDYSYATPNVALNQQVGIRDTAQSEWYEYPGRYEDPARGAVLAKRRAEAWASRSDLATGLSEDLRFEPGKHVTLTHGADGEPRTWLLTSVEHRFVVRPIEHREAAQGGSYENRVQFALLQEFYRTLPFAWMSMVPGPLVALVSAPAGEEIHTDDLGRTKLHFFWDRLNPADDTASLWIRVIQLPLGGSLAVARTGWEMLVRHLYGDPNRPVAVGRMDNGSHTAPYAYPAAASSMAWKTLASPGAARHNEFSMEDSGGRMGLSVTSGYDYSCQVNNNKTEDVAVNDQLTTDVDSASTVTADQTTKIGAAWIKTVSADSSVAVKADRKLVVGAAELITVGGALTEKITGADTEVVGASNMGLAGMSVSRTSLGSQSLTVGGALVTAAGLSVSTAVAGSKSVTVGGVKLAAAGADVTESVIGSLTMAVGGVLVQAAGGNSIGSGKSKNDLKVGGVALLSGGSQVQIKAKTISIQAGAIVNVLGGGGIMTLTPGSGSFIGTATVKASGAVKLKGAPHLPG